MADDDTRSIDIRDIKGGPDLIRLAREVQASGQPRVLRYAGEDLAILASIPDEIGNPDVPKSRRLKKELLALAGVWSDLDADAMIAELHAGRDEAPPSPAIEP